MTDSPITSRSIHVLRSEPHRTMPGRTDFIYRYEFGEPSNHRAVEAWRRCHPHTGELVDKRAAPG